MNIPDNFIAAALCALLSLFVANEVSAQNKTGYQQLVKRSQQDPISVELITLPGKSDSTLTLATVFSLPYSYLPFKKGHSPNPDKKFYSPIELSLEIFKSADTDLKEKEEVSLKGLEAIGRSFWTDTAYAKSYDQSQSRHHFLNGYLESSVKPGTYSYALQMRRGGENKSRMSKTRTVHLSSYEEMKTGNVILGEKLSESDEMQQLTLSSLSGNVAYTKDFYTLAYIPSFDSTRNYGLEITLLDISGDDTSSVNTVYTQQLAESDFITGIRPTLSSKYSKKTRISLNHTDSGYTYALVRIPNKKLPNGMYRIAVHKEKQRRPVASGTFRSIWVDIPTSLLKLDVAIDMLHYVADDKTLDRLSTGTQKEREKKFRNYWKKKDPTPKTEFNELMAEYYRRIDYAYQNFTTENVMGYNSDRGEIYIKFGPPENIERKFPTNGPTTEIWTYSSRKFVFQATTGFGDFRLVSSNSP